MKLNSNRPTDDETWHIIMQPNFKNHELGLTKSETICKIVQQSWCRPLMSKIKLYSVAGLIPLKKKKKSSVTEWKLGMTGLFSSHAIHFLFHSTLLLNNKLDTEEKNKWQANWFQKRLQGKRCSKPFWQPSPCYVVEFSMWLGLWRGNASHEHWSTAKWGASSHGVLSFLISHSDMCTLHARTVKLRITALHRFVFSLFCYTNFSSW